MALQYNPPYRDDDIGVVVTAVTGHEWCTAEKIIARIFSERVMINGRRVLRHFVKVERPDLDVVWEDFEPYRTMDEAKTVLEKYFQEAEQREQGVMPNQYESDELGEEEIDG
jgi:hypothetical protein